MNIFKAYWEYATLIAIFHGFLFVTWIVCFVLELRLLIQERQAFSRLEDSRFKDSSSARGEVAELTTLIFDMSRKGEMPGPDIIRARLSRFLNQYDDIIRFCLNGFIISGLLGTLFNLWKLSPSFWSNLINGQAEAGQPAIGIAFSASVFGLSAALLISFFESFFIRHPRSRFVSETSNRIFMEASKLLPPKEGAAVAQALQQFYSASEGFLTRLKSDHEKLSNQFTEQVKESSGQLVKTLDRIGGNWESLTQRVTENVGNFEARLTAQVAALTNVTSRTESTLSAAMPDLEEARKLSATLMQLRAQAGELQDKINAQLREYSNQWQADFQSLTQAHVERMETSYSDGWARYEEAAKKWHEKSAGALQEFSGKISASIAEWEAERKALGEHVGSLITSWRGELGRAATGVGAGLSDLHVEVDALKKTAAELLRSYNIAYEQLQELRSSVSTFSAEVVNSTPLGEAINQMNETVKDFKDAVNENGKPITVISDAPRDPVVGLILEELRSLSASVSELKGKMLPRVSRSSPEHGPSQGFQRNSTQPPETEKQSLFRRILRRLKIGAK